MDTNSQHTLGLLTTATGISICLCLSAPFERIKLILQTQPIAKLAPEQRLITTTQALSQVFTQQGLTGLWKGNGLNIQKCLSQLFICDYVLKHLHPQQQQQSLAMNVLAASLSTCIASVFLHPMDVVRVRVTVDLNNMAQNRLYVGFYDGCKKIMTNEGIKGLYKGYLLHQLSHLPFYSLSIGGYHYLSTNHTQPVFVSLGAMSVFAARCIVYPMETVTHRLQVNASPDYLNRYKGINDAFSKIYRLEGIKGFYKGFATSTLPLCINAFVFTNIYEVLMDLQLQQYEDNIQ